MKRNRKPPEAKSPNAGEFIKIDPPEPMVYHEYSDYPYCVCGNFEKDDGFNRCDRYGNLIPISVHVELNKYGRCERCGRVIEVNSRTIIGRIENFNKHV
ncbi:hypothetical protein BDE36_2417 [Arcticibacter tournemirensis]|uniref:Transposase n=1 Tax=Arcticibacter tournemirensis TaxID=699437 RepID=A0A5M9GZE5_9SPHI|nr:hypothetical protein [Arcticibacter tournemirensis]KAA8480063.1 hypothetical protein F1649_15675 [Arcticibacter tournemirensis]TQM50663.1 hypothetical protein BDE36_2417 [Arcticibacter tournemirensis]